MAMGVIRVISMSDVVARHYHLYALGQLDGAGYVRGPEVELGTIAVEERGMTAAFILGQHVHLAVEVGVGMNAAGLGQHLAALDLGTLNAAQQQRRCCRPPSA